MSVVDWLLDSDPGMRWQALRDLTDAPADEVAAERAKVATEGWGARLLALQGPDGRWGGGTFMPYATSTFFALWLLQAMGLDPASDAARRAVARVRDARWEYDQRLRFFEGEVEPCINGRVVAIGAYFGEDVRRVVDRLLGEQMADGGWNCEQQRGSTRGSFDTTICVLEGLLEFERATGGFPAVAAARARGEEYLLVRRLLRRLSTGEVIDERWTRFSFPPGYHYDVLRALDHLRAAGRAPDARIAEALELVRQKRGVDGRWVLEKPHAGEVHLPTGEDVGEPSRWNTLRAMRVLRWADGA
ncbi:MAG TPA: hypothetical protein VFM93_13880 [Candidatus Limnocylindria bacterium]|nr:hypothetical protein [Candidatus Limnocylindria bacterium]